MWFFKFRKQKNKNKKRNKNKQKNYLVFCIAFVVAYSFSAEKQTFDNIFLKF